jgi:hypothetical protein
MYMLQENKHYDFRPECLVDKLDKFDLIFM